MILKKSFIKKEDKIIARLQVLDSEDYYTDRVIPLEKGSEVSYESFAIKEFPLTPEGQKQALQWVEEKIQEVRKHIHYWREFELPPNEEVEI